MATAARMHGALERVALEGTFSRRLNDVDGGEEATCLAAINDVISAVEREETWPRFINVLRARGPELREWMLRLVDAAAPLHERPPRSLRRSSLLARLAEAGLGEESLGLVDHAQRMTASARGLWYLFEEEDPDHVRSLPQASEHAREGEKAAWMYTFALVILGRAAYSPATVAHPSTELAVILAVEASRDTCAHWATALELLAEPEVA
jgi:hypothetical protein